MFAPSVTHPIGDFVRDWVPRLAEYLPASIQSDTLNSIIAFLIDADRDNANHGVDEEGDNAVERFRLDACRQIFCKSRNPVADKVANRMSY